MSPEAFQIFYGMLEPESVRVVLEEFSTPYFQSVISPSWPLIHVPALVVDGALDINVGAERAQDLFDALGSDRKQLVILPRNAHCWLLEDNSEATMRVFNRFLSKFE
jgi:esterase/lipase